MLFERIDRVIGALAYAMAMAGGLVLIAMSLMTVASIAGRALVPIGLAPVPGDYELVEFGAAFAVFAMLPLTQRRRGHVTVDLAMQPLGPRANAWIDVAADILMAAAALVIAWRLGLGLSDKMGSGFYVETSFILGWPIWWGYIGAFVGAVVFALVSLWSIVTSLKRAREHRPRDSGGRAGAA